MIYCVTWECEIRHEYKHDIAPLIDRIVTELLAYSPDYPKKLSMKFYEQIENRVMIVAEDIIEYRVTPKQ